MEKINLIDYIQWIASTNAVSLTKEGKGFPDAKAQFIIGMIEEYLEWLECSREQETLELGDVLAYYCLAMTSLGYTAKEIFDYLSSNDTPGECVLLNLTSAGKRVLRGDSDAEVLFAKAGAAVLSFLMITTRRQRQIEETITFDFIAALNKNKLEKRLAATGTFKGSGDR